MTFSDIFKNSFLDNVTTFSFLDTAIALGISFALGIFLFFVYKKTFKGVMYSETFAISLMSMSLITTLIILAVTSNIILSLGMVGALSIVRFRTSIKDPLDIAFLFWAISIGIVTGAGLFPLAVFGSIFIGIILMVFVNRKSHATPYLLALQCVNESAEEEAMHTVGSNVKKFIIKSKTVNKSGIEITMEVSLHSTETNFINKLVATEGVTNAVLVTYNGDYMT